MTISDEIILAGNGPSLLKIPRSFFESRRLFGLNYLPYYTNLKIDIWTSWDMKCLDDNIPKLKKYTDVFLPHWHKNYVESNFPHQCDQIGFVIPYPEDRHFSSSMLWALHLLKSATKLKRVIIVGYDCTVGNGVYLGKGKGANQHFYDPKGGGPPRYAASWDKQLGQVEREFALNGIHLVNCSPGSQSKYLPAVDWMEYV